MHITLSPCTRRVPRIAPLPVRRFPELHCLIKKDYSLYQAASKLHCTRGSLIYRRLYPLPLPFLRLRLFAISTQNEGTMKSTSTLTQIQSSSDS